MKRILQLSEIAYVFTGARLPRYKENTKKQEVIIKIYSSDKLECDMENVSKDLDEKFYTKKGDILIRTAQPNTISLVEEEGKIIPMYYLVVRTKKEFNSYYVYHFLKNVIIPSKLRILTEGTVLKTIRVHTLRNIKIPIPKREEQDKIGELLNLIDKKIDLKNKEIDVEKEIQKSVLSKIVEEY